MAREQNKNLFKNSSPCSEVKGYLSGKLLPVWLQGVILYNGPSGIFDLKNMSVNHWRDGLAMLSAFRIEERGKYISLTKKFLRSDAFNEGTDQGKLVRTEFGTPGMTENVSNTNVSSCSSYRSSSSPSTPSNASDNCNISFYQYGNLLMATNEGAFDRIVDLDSLETRDTIDMSSMVNFKTGRPLRDHNGDTYNLTSSYTNSNNYHFMKIPRPAENSHFSRDSFMKESKIIATIPSRFPNHLAYNHSFGMTDNYLILCEQPIAYDINKYKSCKTDGKCYKDCLDWMPGELNRFYIVDKVNGQQIQFNYITDKAYFFLNFVNCYEYGNHIVIDILTYDSPDVMNSMYMNKLRDSNVEVTLNESDSRILRFVLPLEAKEQGIDLNHGVWNGATACKEGEKIKLTPRFISKETGSELPVVNPNFKFRKYNFTYVVGWFHGLNSSNSYANAITKVDMQNGETCTWRAGDDCAHPSEAVFVPNPAGISEDDGVLVSCVSNSRDQNRGYIVFINARNMQEISRAYFDTPIPFGSHTTFIQKFF
ncbi:beta,beta-carotene 15,15'-dioxygenase [Lepeophtheirus salmonis]|uniref:beta,beta-carotene 15,15'-dioxygenase n=1 Tax=Lepeophtheirus salmonis TaxID=72036 RepID=UPI001AEB8FC4|nr:beta,beta-carotene 15,15'-dioxygenase-like [Lepeophtheirus salmonis]